MGCPQSHENPKCAYDLGVKMQREFQTDYVIYLESHSQEGADSRIEEQISNIPAK